MLGVCVNQVPHVDTCVVILKLYVCMCVFSEVSLLHSTSQL